MVGRERLPVSEAPGLCARPRRWSPGGRSGRPGKGWLGALVLIGLLVLVAPGPARSTPAHVPSLHFAGPEATARPGTVDPVPRIPGGSAGSLQIDLHNALAVPTGPYQQPVTIDSARYASLINSNWSNAVAYYTGNLTPVDAWIESNPSNRSTDTVLYLALGSIPASGWANLSIFFWPKSSSNLSAAGPMGEAPELSLVYGEFDDGRKVFNFYDNFSGPALAPAWTVNGAWNYTVRDGFHYGTVPGNGAAIYSNTSFTFPAVVDLYSDLFQTPSGSASPFTNAGFGNDGCPGCGGANLLGWAANGPEPIAEQGTGWSNGTAVYDSQQYGIFTTEAVGPSEARFELNYSGDQALSGSVSSGPLPIGLALAGVHAGALSNNQTVVWIRERSYVPVLPTVSVSDAIPYYPIAFAETGLPAAQPWWVNLTGGPSERSQTDRSGLVAPNGSYSFTVGTPDKTYAAPAGAFTVSGAPVSEAIDFGRVTFEVTFTETGLPSMTAWSVALGGVTNRTIGPVGFAEPNGTYRFTVPIVLLGNRSYQATSVPAGSITVRGGAASASVSFRSLPVLSASFTWSESSKPTCTFAPWTVRFQGLEVNGTPPVDFSWTFGDGTPAASGPEVNHTFDRGQAYVVRLTETDASGNTSSVVHTVEPPGPPPCAPLGRTPFADWTNAVLLIGVAAGLAVLAAVIVVVLRRRRPPP